MERRRDSSMEEPQLADEGSIPPPAHQPCRSLVAPSEGVEPIRKQNDGRPCHCLGQHGRVASPCDRQNGHTDDYACLMVTRSLLTDCEVQARPPPNSSSRLKREYI